LSYDMSVVEGKEAPALHPYIRFLVNSMDEIRRHIVGRNYDLAMDALVSLIWSLKAEDQEKLWSIVEEWMEIKRRAALNPSPTKAGRIWRRWRTQWMEASRMIREAYPKVARLLMARYLTVPNWGVSPTAGERRSGAVERPGFPDELSSEVT